MDLIRSVQQGGTTAAATWSNPLENIQQPGFHLAQFSVVQPADNQKSCKSPSFSVTLCSVGISVWGMLVIIWIYMVQVVLCSLDTERKFQEGRDTRASLSLWNPAIVQSYNRTDSIYPNPQVSSFYLIVHRGARLYIGETNWTWLLARLPEIDF